MVVLAIVFCSDFAFAVFASVFFCCVNFAVDFFKEKVVEECIT